MTSALSLTGEGAGVLRAHRREELDEGVDLQVGQLHVELDAPHRADGIVQVSLPPLALTLRSFSANAYVPIIVSDRSLLMTSQLPGANGRSTSIRSS